MRQGWRVIALSVLAGFVALLGITDASTQQVYEGNQTGLPPFGSFHGSNFDNVSLNNGNLHIEIPILTVRQRGRNFTYRYVYDTRGWNIWWLPNPDRGQPKGWWIVEPDGPDATGGEWRLNDNFTYSSRYDFQGRKCGPLEFGVRVNYQIRDPNGTKHQTANQVADTAQGCDQTHLLAPALDGSGMVLDLRGSQAKVLLKDGTSIEAGVWRDSNGNLASSNADMLGRDLVAITTGPNVTYTSPLGRSAFGPEFQTWTIQDSSGNPQVWRLDYEAVDVQTAICGAPFLLLGECIEYGGGPTAAVRPSKLTLPSGSFYKFTWANNSHYELTRIDLPTGGSIEYTYAIQQFRASSERYTTKQARAVVNTRTVNPGGTWNYAYGFNAAGVSTVTDPLGNQELHTFTYLSDGTGLSSTSYETKVEFKEGSDLLRTVEKDYAFERNPLSDLPEANVRVIRETTTLDDGKVSKVETDYETFQYNYNNNSYTATRMNVLNRREYDYGLALKRRISFSYLHTGNQAYIDRNIVVRVATQSVYDAGSILRAQTIFEYDNYTENIQSSGATQHDSGYGTFFTTRGNPTAVKRWRNTDSVWLTTRHQYDDVGNVIKTTDPLNHTTTLSYADAWENSACAPTGGAGRAYLSATTNALNQVTSHTYFSCTGLLASTTDPNLQTATFTYDFMNRPDVTNLPDGGQVDRDYDDAAR